MATATGTREAQVVGVAHNRLLVGCTWRTLTLTRTSGTEPECRCAPVALLALLPLEHCGVQRMGALCDLAPALQFRHLADVSACAMWSAAQMVREAGTCCSTKVGAWWETVWEVGTQHNPWIMKHGRLPEMSTARADQWLSPMSRPISPCNTLLLAPTHC
jgi:hypothetical protein